MENAKNFQKRNYYDKNDSGLALLFFTVIPIVFSFVLVFVLSILKLDATSYSNALWFLIISSLVSPIASIVSVFGVNGINGVKFSAIKISKKLNWKKIILPVLIAVLCFFGMINFVQIFNESFEMIGISASTIGIPLTNFWWLLLYVLLFGLLPGIGEELVFRGIIFNGLRKSYSDKQAVIFSALLFAFMHCSVHQLIYPFVMGIVFALIVLRTGNLVSSIIAHCTNNIIVVIFSYLEINYGVSLYFGLSWWGILLSIAIAGILIAVLLVLDKFVFKKKVSDDMIIERNEKKPISIFMIISIVIIGIMFIGNLF